MVPTVLGGVLGGTVVDRLGHRRTSVLSDLASGVTVAIGVGFLAMGTVIARNPDFAELERVVTASG